MRQLHYNSFEIRTHCMSTSVGFYLSLALCLTHDSKRFEGQNEPWCFRGWSNIALNVIFVESVASLEPREKASSYERSNPTLTFLCAFLLNSSKNTMPFTSNGKFGKKKKQEVGKAQYPERGWESLLTCTKQKEVDIRLLNVYKLEWQP